MNRGSDVTIQLFDLNDFAHLDAILLTTGFDYSVHRAKLTA
jgi:hypothetical protein